MPNLEDQQTRTRRIAKRYAAAKKQYGAASLTAKQLKARLELEEKKLERLKEKQK